MHKDTTGGHRRTTANSSGLCRELRKRRVAAFAGYPVLLIALFTKLLAGLVTLALNSDLHSYIILVPFISAYLLYIRRENLGVDYRSSWGLAIIPFAAGAVAWAVDWNRAAINRLRPGVNRDKPCVGELHRAR
jgi:hypothetical protein